MVYLFQILIYIEQTLKYRYQEMTMTNLSEGYILKDKTIGVNVDKFINRTKSKLLIFGFAGSGKTTLGEKLAKKLRVKWVSIDSLWWRLKEKHFKGMEMKEALRNKKVKTLVYKTVIEYLRNNERMILEGVDLLEIYAALPRNYKNLILDQPMVILGESLLKSSFRAAARNRGREDEGWKTYYWMLQYNFRKVNRNLTKLRMAVESHHGDNIREYKF
jgi:adenylate kinase family enzyme